MSEPASISSGIAERYATAIFEISQGEDKSLTKLEDISDGLAAALDDSAELRDDRQPDPVAGNEQGDRRALPTRWTWRRCCERLA